MGLFNRVRYSAPLYEDQACRITKVYGHLECYVNAFHLGKCIWEFRVCLLSFVLYFILCFIFYIYIFFFLLDKNGSTLLMTILRVLCYMLDVTNGR